ncbi:hypothetical protein ACQ1Q1_10425 [Ornithobacterium rhinotracheale]|uniref:Uncharacterized protein n=1 Tax=Ornithobacterium rhinotracheale (strain ATCC 51463 / DSM 15997 / CCUG 23171 / CIP 104009 / LMG 9086) TaxID=867902 RepID=I3ZZY0_ORNRL|nr:hypothetical protein [Ornithobacterium rhinotracheale]AFL97264.1 hypothetical protein Ornrh_1073 [Ornithobacterium rhinotracheale DSM 15997]AIQ00510.1 hypothetical protein Q785_05970 [Ornithobacterium rhinotracheale ORT-UMN 88]KGB66621.1 hypothetical protein Q787_06125 [Ornithobacterium rhinotracheale H06-030791]MBN3662432.1 hypothetical protein [Ornithobacterium rhinotracheale]MCK0194156.1 hypothetical protein [Ornithobacterium rhinotracheale]
MQRKIVTLAFLLGVISCGKDYEEKTYFSPSPNEGMQKLKIVENDYYDGVHVRVYDTEDIDGEEVYVAPYVDEDDFKKFYKKHMEMKKEYENLKKRYDIMVAEYMKLVNKQ